MRWSTRYTWQLKTLAVFRMILRSSPHTVYSELDWGRGSNPHSFSQFLFLVWSQFLWRWNLHPKDHVWSLDASRGHSKKGNVWQRSLKQNYWPWGGMGFNILARPTFPCSVAVKSSFLIARTSLLNECTIIFLDWNELPTKFDTFMFGLVLKISKFHLLKSPKFDLVRPPCFRISEFWAPKLCFNRP